MRLGLIAVVVTSLASIFIMTQQIKAAQGYEQVLEKGREHRREEMEEASGAVNNGGAIGWRRKRHVTGEDPATRVSMGSTVSRKTAKNPWGLPTKFYMGRFCKTIL